MRKLKKSAVHAGLGSAMLAIPWVASAATFQIGEIQVQVDTTVSAGATFRMQDRSDLLVGITNGGTARSVNDDDGNIRYKKGDVVTAVAKATQDLEITWRDVGLFSRYSYFYDFELSNDDELGPRANDRLGSDAQLLDLFAYARFSLGSQVFNARIGKQVVSWGESTFIQNGLNLINPIDVARLRAPGAELKEALLPVSAFTLSTNLTDALSVEALWLMSFQEILIDPRRSYFSTSDVASDDSDKAFTGFGRRFDDNQPRTQVGTSGEAQVWVDRDPDRDVEGKRKQYGLALRYFAEALNYTEFGFYWLRYHSRVPLLSGVRGGAAGLPNSGASAYGPGDGTDNPTISGDTRYFVEYPEGINLYGLSFNTNGPFGTALQGEYTYRPRLPVQIAPTELLLAILGNPNDGGFAAGLPTGTQVQGWDGVNAHQVQVTATKAFGPQPRVRANQWVFLTELGYNHLDLPDGKVYAGPGAALPSCNNPPQVLAAAAGGGCQAEGYATRSSWGYRAVTALTYDNLLGPVGVIPRLAIAHDVNGVGPNFNQGTKAIGMGVGFNYLQRWQADISYTIFTGGRTFAGTDSVPPGTVLAPGVQAPGSANQSADFATSANPNKDRDFLAINISYAF